MYVVVERKPPFFPGTKNSVDTSIDTGFCVVFRTG